MTCFNKKYPTMKKKLRNSIVVLVFVINHLVTHYVMGQGDLPVYLNDRGTGQPTSMFGTYINKKEFIIYPFYEYYHDSDAEYAPNELGGVSDTDYRGKFVGHEGLIFLGYGISDRLAVEFEAAVMSAKLTRSSEDPEGASEVIEESGLGDVESQIRWRWNHESEKKPEYFSYFETVFPVQKNDDKVLIGTSAWEFKLGSGVVKGFTWGTMTVRLAAEYDGAEKVFEFGEYALEYLKRVSPFFRFYVGLEGSQDELELITDLQFHFTKFAFIRVNNSFGVTSKATDYAPELGVLFHF
jgi:hypothetical protein